MYAILTAPFTAGIGAVLGFLAARDYPLLKRHTPVWLFLLIVAAVVAAVIPNISQALYDLGLSFPQIDLLQAASYVVFGFSIAASWNLLLRSRTRWLLAALIPISFAQPFLWTYAFVSWSIYGFAP